MIATDTLQSLSTNSHSAKKRFDRLSLEALTEPSSKPKPTAVSLVETNGTNTEDPYKKHSRRIGRDCSDKELVCDPARIQRIHDFPTHLSTILQNDPGRDSRCSAASVLQCPLLAMYVMAYGKRDGFPNGPLQMLCRSFIKTGPSGNECPRDRDRTGVFCDIWITNWEGVAYTKTLSIFAEDMIGIVAWQSSYTFALRTSQAGYSTILFQSIRGQDNFERALRFFRMEFSVRIMYAKKPTANRLQKLRALAIEDKR